MQAKLLDGRGLAQSIKRSIREEVTRLGKFNVTPSLAVIIVGDDPASKMYTQRIQKACGEVGIKTKIISLPKETSQGKLEDTIVMLNDDETATGIQLQLPLPGGLEEESTLAKISPAKDVEGLTPYNLGLLLRSKSAGLAPCTPSAVMVLLDYHKVKVSGSHAVIINRSVHLGRPLSQLLLNWDATVTVSHSKTRNLEEVAREADILVTGIGRRPQTVIGATMIKNGATVVDVGTSDVGGKIVGDVDFDAAMHVAGAITPVPGGVGPLTVTMLLYNTVLTACQQQDVGPTFELRDFRWPT